MRYKYVIFGFLFRSVCDLGMFITSFKNNRGTQRINPLYMLVYCTLTSIDNNIAVFVNNLLLGGQDQEMALQVLKSVLEWEKHKNQ